NTAWGSGDGHVALIHRLFTEEDRATFREYVVKNGLLEDGDWIPILAAAGRKDYLPLLEEWKQTFHRGSLDNLHPRMLFLLRRLDMKLEKQHEEAMSISGYLGDPVEELRKRNVLP
ncbi:MAG: hypothetical protein ACYTAF_15630, partial [Planctomycetota bacterium]